MLKLCLGCRSESDSWPAQGVFSLMTLAIAHLAVNFLVTFNHLIPVHQDDYLALGRDGFHLAWNQARPVSSNVIEAVGSIGPWATYLLLNVLVVVVPWMTLRFVERVVGCRASIPLVALMGLMVFTHYSAFEHSRVIGILTNLTSHFFGLAALHAMLSTWEGRHPRSWAAVTSVLLVLCILAKEDFLLPPLILCGYVLAKSILELGLRRSLVADKWIWLSVVGVGIVMLASLLVSLLLADNPFIAGLFGKALPASTVGSYAVVSDPGELERSLLRLTVEFAPGLTATFIAAMVVALIALRRRWLEWSLLLASVIGLMLPYAMLPHNMPPFRVFAWTSWMGASVVLIIGILASGDELRFPRRLREILAICLAAASIIVAALNFRERAGMVGWYADQTTVQARLIESLERHRKGMEGEPLIGIVGVEGLSPWSNTDADYLRSVHGMNQRWRVFVRGSSMFFDPEREKDRAWADTHPHVDVEPLEAVCNSGSLPVLVFNAAGESSLSDAATVCRVMKP